MSAEQQQTQEKPINQGPVDPVNMYRQGPYGSFADDGLPLTDMSGTPLEKELAKKLTKEHDNAKKRYQAWLNKAAAGPKKPKEPQQQAPKKEAQQAPKKEQPKKEGDEDDDLINKFDPEDQAKQVITAIKNYQQPIFAKIVLLGDDTNYQNLTKCMALIKDFQNGIEDNTSVVKNCSIILITGGQTNVTAMASSSSDQIKPSDWIESALNLLDRGQNPLPTIENDRGFVTTFSRTQVQEENPNPEEPKFTESGTPPIKAKETALANSFIYLKKVGAMPKEDEEEEFVDYAADIF